MERVALEFRQVSLKSFSFEWKLIANWEKKQNFNIGGNETDVFFLAMREMTTTKTKKNPYIDVVPMKMSQ